MKIKNRTKEEVPFYEMYCEIFQDKWKICKDNFYSMHSEQIFVAMEETTPVGFVFLDKNGVAGTIQLLAVLPKQQKKGIGTQLLKTAEEWLYQNGVLEIKLGEGENYLWQGVPDGMEVFFQKNGYKDNEKSVDMVMDLQNYRTPCWVMPRLSPDVTIRYAKEEDLAQFPAAFVDEDLAEWLPLYLDLLKEKRYKDILVTIHEKEVAGFLILTREGMTWEDCFGKKVGGVGCVGVPEKEREKGIGLALVATGTTLLQQAGTEISYISWTGLEKWYSKLGYQTWCEFHMMKKERAIK